MQVELSKDMQLQLEGSFRPSFPGRSGVRAAPEPMPPWGKQSSFISVDSSLFSRRVSSLGQENSHFPGGNSFIRASYKLWAANMPSIWGMALACEGGSEQGTTRNSAQLPCNNFTFSPLFCFGSIPYHVIVSLLPDAGPLYCFRGLCHFRSDPHPLDTAVSLGHCLSCRALWPLLPDITLACQAVSTPANSVAFFLSISVRGQSLWNIPCILFHCIC